MKRIVLILMLIPVTLMAQEIKWMSLAEALEAQKKEPRKIMMDVYTNWCGPCKMMDKNTFANPDVAAYVSKYFYAVKFNAEGNENINYQGKAFVNTNYNPEHANKRSYQHPFAAFMRIEGYPSMVFLDEKGDFISPITGYRTPKQLEVYLKVFHTDAYKNINTAEDWQSFQESFVSEFND
ncbi:MAG: thioredoxin fold domain-containing protein [Bacteroidetes bacterium]|nr:thioredoxin fold domain-containing protein [Bacteroidota bacterium]